jgi:hypothetical protein
MQDQYDYAETLKDVEKMAKSAVKLVLSQLTVVDPKGGSPYVRSKRSITTSPKVMAHRNCVAEKMKGQTFKNQAEVRAAFKAASSSCRK